MFKLPKNLSVYGAAALAVATLVLATPRAAHAIAATLVQVTNTTANPVPNLDAERIARIPYESTQQPQGNCPNSNLIQACNFAFTPPPTGYRLVVENVSGWIVLANGTTLPPIAILTDVDNTVGRTTIWSYAGILVQGSGTAILASFNQPAHAVFDAGDSGPEVAVNANWEGGTVQYMTLTGYLENCAITGCPLRVH
jgi:hypothetical protein